MTTRILLALLLLPSSWSPARAQEPEVDFEREFQRGIEALTERRPAEGVAAFERCLELRPKNSTSAYNLACAWTLQDDAARAFEWLARASEWGFGDMGQNIAHAQRDPDLARLRDDPRFAAFIEGMKARRRELEEFRASLEGYWSKPAVYIPAALEGREPLPLLVVLHDAGARKEEVVAGRWRRIADALGMALLAPSGKYAVSREPGAGMSWYDSLEGYRERSWTYERTVARAVQAFKGEHRLDLQRVYLAGEGQGASVAFNVAVTAPGLYRGALLLNGFPNFELARERAQLAGRMGFRAQLVLESSADLDLPAEPSTQQSGQRAVSLLERWGIASRVESLGEGAGPAATQEALLEALRVLGAARASSSAAGK